MVARVSPFPGYPSTPAWPQPVRSNEVGARHSPTASWATASPIGPISRQHGTSWVMYDLQHPGSLRRRDAMTDIHAPDKTQP